MQNWNEISRSILQQKSCAGATKVLGGWQQNPERPFPGGSGGLANDVEKVSEGCGIPCQTGHLLLRSHAFPHSLSGPVWEFILLSSSPTQWDTTAAEHRLPGKPWDGKHQTVRGSSDKHCSLLQDWKHAWGKKMCMWDGLWDQGNQFCQLLEQTANGSCFNSILDRQAREPTKMPVNV